MPNCQNKLARLGALSQRCIKLHAQNVKFFLRSSFLKISDIISSHQNDALLENFFISRWLRFVRFSHSPRISFFLSLQRQSRASPTLSRARHPLAFRLVSQICFGRFVRGLGEAPPSALLVQSSRRPLLQTQMRGHHQRPLRQGDLSP